MQQRRNPLIAIAAIVSGQPDNIRCKGFFIISAHGLSPLQSAALSQSGTGAALGNAQLLLYKNDSGFFINIIGAM